LHLYYLLALTANALSWDGTAREVRVICFAMFMTESAEAHGTEMSMTLEELKLLLADIAS